MRMIRELACALILLSLHSSFAQYPPRLQIPGAVPLQGPRPAPPRQQRINAADFIPTRARRPVPLAQREGVREIRPVVEEEEENYPPSISSFDAEVNKLSNLASSVRHAEEEEEQPTLRPSPQPFRPIPIARDQIREKAVEAPRPAPLPILRPNIQNRPIAKQIRPVVRQELDEDEEDIPTRQSLRPKVRQNPPQQFRQAPAQRPAPRPQHIEDDEFSRRKKPVVQILRKYRTDNEDGSITWGFENDDGTFKEETLGIDCVIKGKYGYVDPDGVRRDFQYEAGNKCDPNQREELDEDEEDLDTRIPSKQPAPRPKPQYQPQFRPQQLSQY
ncbi:unnamed protein product [Phaedon cochleariae]|uniref:Uncharacterized protein n=1 Tax=Phaedon cochleariae TaxID=80249 RepID=A0A9P0GLH3_PHACE|nr:unnamed protein product [Phaedon cochleariae]